MLVFVLWKFIIVLTTELYEQWCRIYFILQVCTVDPKEDTSWQFLKDKIQVLLKAMIPSEVLNDNKIMEIISCF